MPNPTEIAQIVCNGQIYDAWTSVEVVVDWPDPLTTFRFTCVEPVSKNATFKALQLKPSDSVDIILAGHKVISGYVSDRQASYDKDNHGVMIQGYSKFIDAIVSEVPIEQSQFRNYSFEQIAKKILKPFGISIAMEHAAKDAVIEMAVMRIVMRTIISQGVLAPKTASAFTFPRKDVPIIGDCILRADF
ncbi:phage baseplate assembly protein [Methylocella silvestris]|uniref:Baseplate hub protein gp44-like N-terminal domain-containing protein n=1 Tax=Methylocella silvestris TaxID=199596 RepID=A0A2J7TMC0_METSI|nr:hypothetical protein [Methylocella silvestris]PNG27900.1 hypothetical protein CR492_03150 [Methylocella silvestris]